MIVNKLSESMSYYVCVLGGFPQLFIKFDFASNIKKGNRWINIKYTSIYAVIKVFIHLISVISTENVYYLKVNLDSILQKHIVLLITTYVDKFHRILSIFIVYSSAFVWINRIKNVI